MISIQSGTHFLFNLFKNKEHALVIFSLSEQTLDHLNLHYKSRCAKIMVTSKPQCRFLLSIGLSCAFIYGPSLTLSKDGGGGRRGRLSLLIIQKILQQIQEQRPDIQAQAYNIFDLAGGTGAGG